jgi:uncharacterized protein (TIGR00369 family)
MPSTGDSNVLDELKRWFASVPLNAQLGLEIVDLGETTSTLRMPLQPWFAQEMGVVHGGIITTIADTAAVYALHPEADLSKRMTSIEFKLNFLRAGRLDDGPIEARARVVRKGRTVAVCSVDVWQKGEIIATGLFTYLIYDKKGSAGGAT